MSKLISRLFGSHTSIAHETEPTLPNPETLLKEIEIRALSNFSDISCKDLLHHATARSDISLPTLTSVHIDGDTAYVTEVEVLAKTGPDGLPLLKMKSSVKDHGRLYDGDVFVSDDAVLNFSEEELEAKISAKEIGAGTCFLANSIISETAIFGKNCIISQNCKIFGGTFGDNTILGRNVWVGEHVEVASGTLIGEDTSLNGKIQVGFDLENDTGIQPSFVMIGNSCALEDCCIMRRSIVGKHCLVENNPAFFGLIPDGATVVGKGDTFAVIPY